MMDQATLDIATDAALAARIRVLQGYRLAPTDAEHVSALLGYIDPPRGSRVVDVGCGFGEVARLMADERDDLTFVLLNRNAKQLAHAPQHFQRVQGDMHSMPFADSSVDCLMYLYSLCHADFRVALHEAARVVRPGGELAVFDYERTGGDNALMESVLYARAIPMQEMEAIGRDCGLSLVEHCNPDGDDAVFRAAFANDEGYDAVFDDLKPVIWKMRRDH
jgi:ubiquinone/menaquinone biosynthesis C-methylase UbiE